MCKLFSLKISLSLSLSLLFKKIFSKNTVFRKGNFIIVLNGVNKRQTNILEMRIKQDVIRHGWRIRSQFPANRNQRTKRVRTRLLICGLSRKTRLICGWIRRRPRPLDDSLTRTILLSFVLAIGPSRRAAASAGARKLLSSYSRFGRVNGTAWPFKGRKSNYVISWYAEEAVAILDDEDCVGEDG